MSEESHNINNEDSNIIKIDPVEINGTTYSEFKMRNPTYNELLRHYDVIEKIGTKEGQIALGELTKLCCDIKRKSDFELLDSSVANKLCNWVGKHIA